MRMKKWFVLCLVLLGAAACLYLSHVPDAGRIHIYSQGDEKWLQVAYGPEGSGKTLNEQGCGVFALAHAAQWLGLEEKDERETLPVSMAGIFCPEGSGYYTNEGMDVCTRYFWHTAYRGLGVVSGWSSERNLSLKQVLRRGGVAVLHIKSPSSGHWVLAAALSPDGSKVLVIDSCVNVIDEAGLNAYTYEKKTKSFVPVEDWIRLSGNGQLRGGAAYWLDYEAAAKRHSGQNYIMPERKVFP